MTDIGLRVYLTAPMRIESGGHTVDDRTLPGRHGRVAFAYLVLERRRPVTKDRLADIVWSGLPPTSWESSLAAIASKIRTMLAKAELPEVPALVSALGCYELRLPADAWVDVEAAFDAQHEADVLMRTDAWRDADGPNTVAYHISRRAFLPGSDGEWAERVRRKLRETYLRAVDLKMDIYLRSGEPEVVVTLAEEALSTDPFSEPIYRKLIRAHIALGRRADAVRAYERCRGVLAAELGIEPAAETTGELSAL